jgi:hypothetical protein
MVKIEKEISKVDECFINFAIEISMKLDKIIELLEELQGKKYERKSKETDK